MLRVAGKAEETTLRELHHITRIHEDDIASMLRWLHESSIFLEIRCGRVDLRGVDRMSLAITAVEMGVDVEVVSRNLDWRDFERFIEQSLNIEDFKIVSSLYFTMGKRYQIDLIGVRKPLMLLIDCKHWRYGYTRSRMIKTVEDQIGRTEALSTYLEKRSTLKGLTLKPGRYYLLPVIASLTDPPMKILNGVPIVSVVKFKDFIRRIPLIPVIESLKYKPIEIKVIQRTLQYDTYNHK